MTRTGSGGVTGQQVDGGAGADCDGAGVGTGVAGADCDAGGVGATRDWWNGH